MSHLIGLYLHVPFCLRKCGYCDFYSCKGNDDLYDQYTSALLAALGRYGEAGGYEADTCYFGGGTPSLLGPKRVGTLLAAAEKYFKLNAAEITLEVNPATASLADFEGYRAAGINRLSIGMQTGMDEELASLGRLHTAKDTVRAVEEARQAGFENLSLDLMLGIPGQTEESLRETLSLVKRLSPEHVSAYLLKIEAGTPFSLRPADEFPGEEAQVALYRFACQGLEEMGLMQYEISNFARPGLASRHNLKYWNGEEYLGLGPAAHSFLNGRRFFYPRDLEGFLFGKGPVEDGAGGDFEEYAMLRLRLVEGLTEEGVRARFGHPIPQRLRRRAKPLSAAGLMEEDERGLRLTRNGFLVSNEILARLLAE